MHRIALPLVIAALLCACESVPQTKSPAAAIAATARSTRPLQISGLAFHQEHMPLAAGATLDVQVIDDLIADAAPAAAAPAATIARARFDAAGSSPLEFVLPIDRAQVEAGARYSLRAVLRDARGHLVSATVARVPITPGTPVEFRLHRATVD
jgi:uncharacterized lipoprotein YbaY